MLRVKVLLVTFVTAFLLFSLSGCGEAAPSNTAAASADVTDPELTEPVDSETEQGASGAGLETESDGRILVAYFSATGTTERLAQQVSEILDADLYEIIPEEAYSDEDLAYYTGGRADQEQDDPDCRPAISGAVEDMDTYDTVLLGYPIWHGQAPRIISTFLESYDFSGKTVIPFCTSQSSGVGSSADNLHELCPDTVNWLEGTRFGGSASAQEVETWLQTVLSDQF